MEEEGEGEDERNWGKKYIHNCSVPSCSAIPSYSNTLCHYVAMVITHKCCLVSQATLFAEREEGHATTIKLSPWQIPSAAV